MRLIFRWHGTLVDSLSTNERGMNTHCERSATKTVCHAVFFLERSIPFVYMCVAPSKGEKRKKIIFDFFHTARLCACLLHCVCSSEGRKKHVVVLLCTQLVYLISFFLFYACLAGWCNFSRNCEIAFFLSVHWLDSICLAFACLAKLLRFFFHVLCVRHHCEKKKNACFRSRKGENCLTFTIYSNIYRHYLLFFFEFISK